MRFFRTTLQLILASLALSFHCFCQSPIPIQKLVVHVKFDGIPDEEAWNNISPFSMIMHTPTFGLEPGQKTSIKMLYDENYIYVGASMFASDPHMIQTFGKKRDLRSTSCDWFGVSFDTYNDKENALLFFTNPNGVRYDAAVSNDSGDEELESLNPNWNTFWEVKTVLKEKTWHAEFKIPISSIRFRETEDDVTMGLSFYRGVPNLNESYIFPAIPYDWGENSRRKPSQFAEVNFQGIKPRKPLYISPYLLSGFEQTPILNTAGTGYDYQIEPKIEPGMDIKYGISTNTTLDLTVNTNFAQVEADDQQFNLTRFSLIYDEKRTFFLERASIFDFSFGGGNALFYSRRIGLHNGSPVRIFGGARLVT